MFMIVGANAGRRKCPFTFSAAPCSAVRQISGRYGSRIISSRQKSLPFGGSSPDSSAMPQISQPRQVMPISSAASATMTALSSRRASPAGSSPSRVKTGTNDAFNAPSPKKARKRFGTWKAMTNMSIAAPAPKKRAVNTSRTSPRIRLASVPAPVLSMPGRMSCFSGIYNAKCVLIVIPIVLVVVLVLVLERPLRTAEAEDEIEDEYDWEQPPHPHRFAREPAMP